MREYELTVVFDLAVAEAGGNDAAPELVDTYIAARKGTILKHDHWGRRRMAYPIKRQIDADYVVSRVELEPEEVTPLEAAMKIDERIYRHLIVRADELPLPPPPREPRRMPGEQQEGADGAVSRQPSAVGEPATEAAAEQPAAAVAAEAAVEAPSPVAEPQPDADPDTAEPLVSAADPAAITPAASEEAAPAADAATADEAEAGEPAAEEQPEVETPLTEAPAAAVESAPTESEAPAEAGTEDEEDAPSA
ncbi:MAG: 30S ribosomal protein S6 [Dehalococcoidia bacterium]